MSGRVSADGEPLIAVRVSGPTGAVASAVALIDTGFTEDLTLPPPVIAALGLERVSQGTALLADGTTTAFDVFVAWVDWHGRPKQVSVHEADIDPLLGMRLLADSTLFIVCKPGGRVEVAPAP
jgi:clan AA aspartic protease